jgi:hypothetical protein
MVGQPQELSELFERSFQGQLWPRLFAQTWEQMDRQISQILWWRNYGPLETLLNDQVATQLLAGLQGRIK